LLHFTITNSDHIFLPDGGATASEILTPYLSKNSKRKVENAPWF